MEPGKILTANLLDILFEGKNKEYGAYELRKRYKQRMTIAMVSMAAICLLFFPTQIFGNDYKSESGKIAITEITLENIKKPEDVLPQIPKGRPTTVTPVKAEIVKLTPPVITKDYEVKEPIPDIDQIEHAQIGTINQDGTKDADFVAPPLEEKGTGIAAEPEKQEEDYEKRFTKVEKEARFPGGMEAWKRYLERNLNAGVAAEDGASKGNYTVTVQFTVDKEGNISDVRAIEIPSACPDCGAEAVKVIKKGPKWEPAVQNDRKVIYQAVQFITFEVAEE